MKVRKCILCGVINLDVNDFFEHYDGEVIFAIDDMKNSELLHDNWNEISEPSPEIVEVKFYESQNVQITYNWFGWC